MSVCSKILNCANTFRPISRAWSFSPLSRNGNMQLFSIFFSTKVSVKICQKAKITRMFKFLTPKKCLLFLSFTSADVPLKVCSSGNAGKWPGTHNGLWVPIFWKLFGTWKKNYSLLRLKMQKPWVVCGSRTSSEASLRMVLRANFHIPQSATDENQDTVTQIKHQ